jgi:hypothetical protein
MRPTESKTDLFAREDLNGLVKQHIQAAVSTSPSQALVALEHDADDLIASGMITLAAKLSGISDDKLVSRVVEIWGFFWDQILPYIEGVGPDSGSSFVNNSRHAGTFTFTCISNFIFSASYRHHTPYLRYLQK